MGGAGAAKQGCVRSLPCSWHPPPPRALMMDVLPVPKSPRNTSLCLDRGAALGNATAADADAVEAEAMRVGEGPRRQVSANGQGESCG